MGNDCRPVEDQSDAIEAPPPFSPPLFSPPLFSPPLHSPPFLLQDATTWKNFQRFPSSYKRIRIGWIAAARHRRAVFEQRLRYFLTMTKQNKRFGMVQ